MSRRVPVNATPDVQSAIREIWTAIDAIGRSNLDMRGNRVINAGRSVGQADYVQRSEADNSYGFQAIYDRLKTKGLDGFPGVLAEAQRAATNIAVDPPTNTAAGRIFYDTATGLLKYSTGTGIITIAGALRIDTFANRGTAGSYKYQLFSASDRNYVSWLSDGTNWIYAYGCQRIALIANKPTSLTTNDAGYLFSSSDYAHTWRWTGSAWEFSPGDPGSGWIAMDVGIDGGVWALCNGGAATVSRADSTTTSITTPNLTGNVFIAGGTYTGSQVAAARATWEAAAVTDNLDLAPITSGTPSGTTDVQSGSGATVAASNHTHAVDPPTHQHALTDANAQLKTFSVANGGLPLHIALAFYVRK